MFICVIQWKDRVFVSFLPIATTILSYNLREKLQRRRVKKEEKTNILLNFFLFRQSLRDTIGSYTYYTYDYVSLLRTHSNEQPFHKNPKVFLTNNTFYLIFTLYLVFNGENTSIGDGLFWSDKECRASQLASMMLLIFSYKSWTDKVTCTIY